MRLLFMGSAELSCRCLGALLTSASVEVVGVVTQPDRPRGRHLAVRPCAVKEMAEAAGVDLMTPEKVNDAASVERIRACRPDVIVVVAYGQILRRSILDLPPLGCVNAHYSLLPRYRGAAPIQWAVANGETVSGVTTMFMNERMDAGDVILQREVPVSPDDTGGSLHDKLADPGRELLLETLGLLAAGRCPRQAQDERLATLAPKLSRSDGRIDWSQPSERLHNRIRGFNPTPGCFCLLPGSEGRPLKVWSSRVSAAGRGEPGALLACTPEGPAVATGDGALILREVQPEGRGRMAGAAYLCGHAIEVGERFG